MFWMYLINGCKMQLSSLSKNLIVLMVIYGLCLFLLYPASIVDYSQYQDQLNYLKGFQAIRVDGWLENYDKHFGSSSELFLPFLYLLYGVILNLKSVEGIIGLNHFIFTLSLSILIITIVTSSNKLALSTTDKLLVSLMIVALIPLGAPSQLSRQAITIVLLMSLVFALPPKWRWISAVITPLLHVGSVLAVLAATYVDKPKKNVIFLLCIVLMYIAVVFFLSESILFDIIRHPTFRFRIMGTGLPVSFAPAVFVILYFVFLYNINKFVKFVVLSFLILTIFYPMIFFQRVFWGQIFIMMPIFLYYTQLSHKQNYLKLKNQILVLIFLSILIMKTIVISL